MVSCRAGTRDTIESPGDLRSFVASLRQPASGRKKSRPTATPLGNLFQLLADVSPPLVARDVAAAFRDLRAAAGRAPVEEPAPAETEPVPEKITDWEGARRAAGLVPKGMTRDKDGKPVAILADYRTVAVDDIVAATHKGRTYRWRITRVSARAIKTEPLDVEP